QRKNGWTVAEQAGHDGPDRIQRMLNRIEWDANRTAIAAVRFQSGKGAYSRHCGRAAHAKTTQQARPST
ncbi:hypothetical protein, partial [Streptomyces sp. 900105245]